MSKLNAERALLIIWRSLKEEDYGNAASEWTEILEAMNYLEKLRQIETVIAEPIVLDRG